MIRTLPTRTLPTRTLPTRTLPTRTLHPRRPRRPPAASGALAGTFAGAVAAGLAGIVAMGLTAWPSPARADYPDRFGWDDALRDDDPSAEDVYRRHMRVADRLAKEAAVMRLPQPTRQSRARAELAVEAYESAAAARPDAGEPHYRAAEVLNEHFLDTEGGPPVIRDRRTAARALAHWEAFARLSPLDPRVRDALFRTAIVHTKLAGEADLERAVEAYQLLLARTDLATIRSENAATWLGNLAETYMMLGRLDDAIATYQRALSYANRALYAYGLAVALDRDEQGYKAREVMRDYAESDRLRALDQRGIFFVPEGERHYYLALGYEALGELDAAVAHYEQFIASGAHPRYQARAAGNLREVERMRKARPVRRPAVDIELRDAPRRPR